MTAANFRYPSSIIVRLARPGGLELVFDRPCLAALLSSAVIARDRSLS